MENKNFEQLLNELEITVRKLEDKDISLDDAVKNYTAGIELSKKCYDILSKNEELVAMKMTENGLKKIDEE